MRCPGCQKLHLIADRLGYFEDESVDVESLMARRGEAVRRGSASMTTAGSGGSSGGGVGGMSGSSRRGGSSCEGAQGGSAAAPAAASSGGGSGSLNGAVLGSVLMQPHPVQQGGGDPWVIELNADDLAVLATAGKAFNVKTREEVVDELEYRGGKGAS